MIFKIYKYLPLFVVVFTRGIPGKTKKFESENENEGRSSNFGRFLSLKFLKTKSRSMWTSGFFSKQNIVGSHGVPDPPSLAQMTFTQCTSMSELKIDSVAPPGGQI